MHCDSCVARDGATFRGYVSVLMSVILDREKSEDAHWSFSLREGPCGGLRFIRPSL